MKIWGIDRAVLRQKLYSLLIVFAAYLVTAQLGGYLYRSIGTSPALIWAPVGIALAAVILEGYAIWPAIALAALTNAFINEAPFFLTLGSVLGNTIQPLIGGYFLRRFNFNRLFEKVTDMFLLIGVALVGTMIVPTINALSIYIYEHFLGGTIRPIEWVSWWVGGALSALVITPLLVRWIRRPMSLRSPAQLLEIGSAFVLLIAVSFFLFGTAHVSLFGVSHIFLLMAALLWIAFRGGPRFMTLALFTVTVISLIGALYGTHPPSASSLGQRIFGIEVFDLFLAFFFFLLVTIEEQRKFAIRSINKYTKELEDSMEKVNMEGVAKNEFIATLGHELRNPLASLLSSIELVRLRSSLDVEANELIEIMDNQVRTMARLLDDLLDISRITQKKFVLTKELVSLRTVMERSAEMSRPLIEKYNHHFTISYSTEDLTIEVDPIRLQQVIVNLLNNAAKYTPPRGRIDLSASFDSENLSISVRDSGFGLTPETAARIFEPFVQVSPKANRGGGMGVGLSLTKNLVEMHGGDIEVRSGGLGKGSEFTVNLPASAIVGFAQAKAPHEESTEIIPYAKEVAGLKILLVDDNQEAADGLRKLLQARGHSVSAVYDGTQALDVITSLKPNVVVLDIGLPDMNGYEVARQFKANNVPSVLVALTGYGQESDRKLAAEAGFDYHLTKPIGLADIETVLTNISLKRA